MAARAPFWGAGPVNSHQCEASASRSSASLPVRPPIKQLPNTEIDVYPNEVFDGAEAAEAEEEDTHEEWAPAAPTSPLMPTQADRERHVLGGHVQFRYWCAFCV